MRVWWWFLTFTTKQNKESTHPLASPSSEHFPRHRVQRSRGHTLQRLLAPEPGSGPLLGSAPRSRGDPAPGDELAGSLCLAGSWHEACGWAHNRPLAAGNPENEGSIWLASGRRGVGEGQTWTFSGDFAQNPTHTKACSPGKWKPKE